MKTIGPIQIAQIILIWLIQVLLLNEIELFTYINPIVYPLIILILPAETKSLIVLIVAFVLGMGVDIFENSGGLHSFALTTLAFIRPSLLRLVSTQKGLDFDRLSLEGMGLRKFLIYVGLGLVIHHYVLFSLDAFTLYGLVYVLPQTLYTGVFSTVIILIGYILLVRKKSSST